MKIIPLSQDLIPGAMSLMAAGEPFIRVRTESDYWLYATLFSSTCPVAVVNEQIVGVVIAMRSQDNPGEVYIQDVMTHPDHRRRGVAAALISSLRDRTAAWGCHRIWLTSEADNTAAHTSWLTMGFRNLPGDRIEHGVSVTNNIKGPGKDRAIYQLNL